MVDQDACLRERGLVPVIANIAIAPFWLVPFTVLVSALTKDENETFRLQSWIGAALLSTCLLAAGVTAHRRHAGSPTPRWIVMLLRAGLGSMGVVFGMATWVASSASIEMVMLFAVFPTTASAIAAMLTAGRRDMFVSLLVPMAAMSAFTLATSVDLSVRAQYLRLWEIAQTVPPPE